MRQYMCLSRPTQRGVAIGGLAILLSAAAAVAQPAPDLIQAVRDGRLDVAGALIDHGADPNTTQGDGATALHHAAHRDDLDAVELLIEAGATVGTANDLGATPLWLAAMNGSASMVARLLDAGADVDAALTMGETPLMTAARSGDLETVELLLAHGADVNAVEHERQQTALMWAAAQQHPRVAQILIDHGVDIHARTTVWDQLENTAGNTNPIGNYRMSHGGSTPLLFAARQGDVDTARVLVEAGADINDVSAAGTSALVIAAHSGHGPLGIYLLAQGADPNAAGAGYTALHAAVLRSQVHLASALLDHGADANAVLQHGTPGRRFSADYGLRYQWIGANVFWLAAKYGELEILRLLAKRGADSLSTPANGMSSIQAAMGITQSTEDRRNRVGTPPPDPVEAEQLAYQLAQITLGLGVDVTTADDRGDTALHYAVRQGYGSVIELLADAGADLNATNARGQTPLSLADRAQPFRGGYVQPTGPPVAELLKRLGATDPDSTTSR